MKTLIFILVFFTPVIVQAQPLTGTWLSYYYREKPDDKRMSFYRLYLKQSKDSLYGIYELLNIEADDKGLHPNQATVIARRVVYNNSFSSTDSFDFQLFIRTAVEDPANGFLGIGKKSPYQILNCNVVSKEMPFHTRLPIIYSKSPISDGPIGKLYMQKVSDSIPDFSTYVKNSIASSKKPDGGDRDPKLLRRKVKKEEKSEVKANVALPLEKRSDEIQATFITRSEMVKIELYDNGEIDNDTVSLYMNGNLLLDRERLSSRPLRLDVKLERGKENKLLLFAHNLGSIPPNTAFMMVTLNTLDYRVNLSSSLQKNAVIVFKKE